MHASTTLDLLRRWRRRARSSNSVGRTPRGPAYPPHRLAPRGLSGNLPKSCKSCGQVFRKTCKHSTRGGRPRASQTGSGSKGPVDRRTHTCEVDARAAAVREVGGAHRDATCTSSLSGSKPCCASLHFSGAASASFYACGASRHGSQLWPLAGSKAAVLRTRPKTPKGRCAPPSRTRSRASYSPGPGLCSGCSRGAAKMLVPPGSLLGCGPVGGGEVWGGEKRKG